MPRTDNGEVEKKSKLSTRVPVTPEMIETLLSHRERTGMGFGALLRGRKDRPRGISSGVMYNVARGLNKTVEKDVFDYFIALYEGLDESIPLTPEMVQAMKKEAERTGVNVKALLERSAEAPAALKPARAKHLLYGEQSTIFRDEYEFIIGAYAAIPTPLPAVDAPGRLGATSKPSSEFALCLTEDLMRHVDSLVQRLGFTSRVECIRQMIRQDLIDNPPMPRNNNANSRHIAKIDNNIPNANMRVTLTPALQKWA